MSQDASRQGGDLSDMAVSGTSIPNDAGTQRTIPSVPNPEQASTSTTGGLGAPDLASAADNGRPQDGESGATGEVITATGDQLPAGVESKRLDPSSGNDAAKGHPRDEKHRSGRESGF